VNIPLQVHSGDPIKTEYFMPVCNNPNDITDYRPYNGYWLSDYTPNEIYPSPWIKFVYSDPEMIEYHNRPYYCIYKVKENSKIYVINAYEDFMKLIVKYPLKRDFNANIDFEKAATEWDGIYLTSKGFQDCLEPRKEILKKYFNDENIQPTLNHGTFRLS
jgi:hypothetical protein